MEAPNGTDITSVALGDVYRDTVTGFEGKVVGRADYLTGCAQALVSQLVAGRVESLWLDYPRLELVATAQPEDLASQPAVRRSGGPHVDHATARPEPRI